MVAVGDKATADFANQLIADTNWVPITTTNTTSGDAAYRVKNGQMTIRVNVGHASVAVGSSLTIAPAGTIPAAYRPPTTIYPPSITASAIGYMQVSTDGSLVHRPVTAAMTVCNSIVPYPVT